MKNSKKSEQKPLCDNDRKIVDFGDIFYYIKPFGLWQLWIALSTLPCLVFLGLVNGSLVFALISPTYWCTSEVADINYSAKANQCYYHSENSTNLNVSSTQLQVCDKWEYNQSLMTSTIVTQWNLVCSQKYDRASSQMVYMLGYMVGSGASGYFSDRFGRRKTLLVVALAAFVSGMLQAFVPFFWLFAFLRFVSGCAAVSISLTAFVFVNESTSARFRPLVSAGYVSYAIGYAAAGGAAYLARDWRNLNIIVFSPFLLGAMLIWFLPESPRWLLSQGRFDEAQRVLMKAAICNGSKFPQFLDLKALNTHLTKNPNKGSWSSDVLTLFTCRPLFIRTIILTFCWFAIQVMHFGMMLSVAEFSGSLFLNTMFYGLAEMPSHAYVVLMGGFSRKRSLAFCFFLTASALFSILWVGPGSWKLILSLLGKFGITTSLALIYLYNSELYPTGLRSSALGVPCMISGIGAIISPYIALISVWHQNLRFVSMGIYGGLAALAGLGILILPETSGLPLPETIAEALNLGRGSAKCVEKPKVALKSSKHENKGKDNSDTIGV